MNTETHTSRVVRVRHELRRRTLHIAAIDTLSPHVRAITFGGEALQGFVSASFDDHVKLILNADSDTPVGAARRLMIEGRGDFLLESVEGGEVRGRYSLLGLDPDLVFRATGAQAALGRQAAAVPAALLAAVPSNTPTTVLLQQPAAAAASAHSLHRCSAAKADRLISQTRDWCTP